MTTYIPEWANVTGRQMQLKRVFNKLDDSFVLRKCIAPDAWVPDFFLHRHGRCWLAIVVFNADFDSLDPEQLIEPAGLAEFFTLADNLRTLDGLLDNAPPISKLMLMWGCTAEQTGRLAKAYPQNIAGIRLMSRQTFMEVGEEHLPKMLVNQPDDLQQAWLGRLFPETEIPALCTTRRSIHRDNSAKTLPYFLDTQQEWAAKLDLDLPEEQSQTAEDCSIRLVNGVAGSGKTLIAVSRALLLARTHPEQQVLMLIHNKPVVVDLNQRLRQVYGHIPKNLRIMRAFAWFREQWVRQHNSQPAMASNKEVAELIAEARKRWPEIKPDNKKLQDELDFINDAMITSEEHYLEVDRAGQGFALRAAERVQLWELFEVVKQGLASKGKRLWSSLPRDIALAPQDGTLNLYRHILIDEAQFFAPSWFQVVKHSLEPQQGSLFLCADPNQGFMKSRLSWKRVGLDVAGKTKKLRRSYRTTQRILEAANQVLVEYTDADAEDFLTPDFEGMTPGQPPLLIISDSPQDAVSQLCNEIRDGSNQLAIPLSSMLVVYGPGVSERLLETRLGEALGTGRLWNLSTGLSTPQAADYLRLARLDTATGLEANSVFLIGLEPLLARGFENAAGATGKAKEIEESARKLYMAMTRAGQRLIVVNSQPIPATLARLFEQPCTVAAT